jgi:hypothetical protein
MVKKVFMVWFPQNNICESRAQLRILFIAGYLPLFETETGINTKTLVVEIPECMLVFEAGGEYQKQTLIPSPLTSSQLGD